jgi:hypothetical protein
VSNQEEGSGDGLIISSAAPPGHHEDLIVPTRSSQHLHTTSSLPPVPYDTQEEEEEEPATAPTNHKPFIANRLDKLPLIAGKSSRIIIPANTFQAFLQIRISFR